MAKDNNAKARTPRILVVAVDNEGNRSNPFTVYDTKAEELPKEFVLKVEDAINRDQAPVLRIGNAKLGLICSHQVEYLEATLEGFRRKVVTKEGEEVMVVLARVFDEGLPSATAVKKIEVY